MKHRITMSVVLTLCVLLSLFSFPMTGQGQQPQRFRFATGVITPGPDQLLRITLRCGGGKYCPAGARILWAQYKAAGCSSDGLCRHIVESQGATAPLLLEANEAASFDLQGAGGAVRVVVESNLQNLQVNAMIIDSGTGKVVSLVIAQPETNPLGL